MAAHQPNRLILEIPRKQTQAQRRSLGELFQKQPDRDQAILEATARIGTD